MKNSTAIEQTWKYYFW